MKILAAVAREPSRPFALESHELEAPRHDEVLVRIHSSGICHTDIAVRDRHMPIELPIILGHEGAGIVERVGSRITHVVPGDHVVLTMDYCGECRPCVSGSAPYCVHLRALNLSGRRLDGTGRIVDDAGLRAAFFGQSSFATYALGSSRNVVKVPKDIDLGILGQLGCGIQTGAGAVLNRLQPKVGSTLLVCGAGPVGIAAIMAAKIAGCSVIAVLERRPKRLAAAQGFGATHIVDGSIGDAAFAMLREICPDGFDGIVESTGVQQVINQVIPLLAPLATCVLLVSGATVSLPLSPLLSGGRNVCGVSSGHLSSDRFIPKLIEFYRDGRFPIDRLVTRFLFDQINEACAAAENGEVIKSVVLMPGL